MIAARLRRVLLDRRELPRRLLWRDRPGYRARPGSSPPIASVEAPAPAPPPESPQADGVGIIELEDARPSAVAAAAGLLGLAVESASHVSAAGLIDRALAGRWPLIAASLRALAGPGQPLPAALETFVRCGGTLYLDGLDERSNPALRRLGEALAVTLPEVRRAPAAHHLLFPGDRAGFARELAGARLGTACGERELVVVADEDVLAQSLTDGGCPAAVVERHVGRGRVVLSVLSRPVVDRPSDIMESEQAGGFLVPVLLLRELYGRAAWHAPAVLANWTIDDPALRRDGLGLSYDLLTARAREHGFHVTIATMPCELALAEGAVVRHLRDHPQLLSACYHGCDHDGYEFYLTRGARTRHRPRPLEDQRAALRRAVDHGRRFADAHHLELDRVMVFPHGIGPASLFGDLHHLGFLATCNLGDRYPLEAPVPAQPDLGLRPADLAWEGFPLLWRRRFQDDGYLLDLLLGRPVLLFSHRREAGHEFAALVERAGVVNRSTHGTAVWRGLEEVARHAYLQRLAPESGWQVLMTANEACLHNPDVAPRTYAVRRPHLPPGSAIAVDGQAGDGDGPLLVKVPPGSTAIVRLVHGGAASALGRGRPCTVWDPGREGRSHDTALEVAG